MGIGTFIYIHNTHTYKNMYNRLTGSYSHAPRIRIMTRRGNKKKRQTMFADDN